MPLTTDMLDVLQEFANADLLPLTYSRVVAPTQYYGGVPVPGTGAYVDQGPLPVDETVVVPTTDDEDAERDEMLPAGERSRGRIVVYTSVQLRAGRNADLSPDRVTTVDGRVWQVAHAEDWSASGNFWMAECELVDANVA